MAEHPLTTRTLPLELFVENRKRLLSRLRNRPDISPGSLVYLEGGHYVKRYDTESEVATFRQESFFFWTFGVTEPGFSGVIDADSGDVILFTEELTDLERKQRGVLSVEEFRVVYGATKVMYETELLRETEKRKPSLVLILDKLCKRKDLLAIDGKLNLNDKILREEMEECRVKKTTQEIDVLRFAHKISSDAHKMLMRAVRPGMFEYQVESLYLHYCMYHANMRHAGWPNVVASGHTGAIKSHGRANSPHTKRIHDGDMCMFDLGTEYYCHVTDITTTFPANGKFTEDQRLVYEAVYRSSRAVMAACKPGVRWVDMHLLAAREMLAGLRTARLVRGDLQEMMDVQLWTAFIPFGVGHLVGLDVVDVGGYRQGEERASFGTLTLRTNRVLEPGIVITIEPSCLFVDQTLDDALANPQMSKYLCADRIKDFRGTGGMRIEDTVVVTEDGVENLVDVPRTVQEVEQWMAGGDNIEKMGWKALLGH